MRGHSVVEKKREAGNSEAKKRPRSRGHLMTGLLGTQVQRLNTSRRVFKAKLIRFANKIESSTKSMIGIVDSIRTSKNNSILRKQRGIYIPMLCLGVALKLNDKIRNRFIEEVSRKTR